MNTKASSILKKTIELLVESGIEKVSMDQIASYGKTSKATIYKYFGDKDNFYYEIGKYVMDEKLKEYRSIVSASSSLLERLLQYTEAVCKFTDCGHFALCNQLMGFNIEVKKVYKAYKQESEAMIISLIREGVEQNMLKPELSEEMIYSYIDMGIEYYQANEVYRFRMNNDMKFQKNYMEFFLSNIFTDQFWEAYRNDVH